MPAIHNKEPLLTPQKIEVFSRGEVVVLKIGNTELGMHYEDALRISQFIRLRAKEAKTLAGDTSRHWSAVGNLEGIK